MANKDNLPKFDQLMVPILSALKALGGSATNDELFDRVAATLNLSDDLREVVDSKRGVSELAYRMAWARTYLKGYGALENSERGVWSLTELGERITEADVEKIKRDVRAVGQARRKAARLKPVSDLTVSDEAEPQQWNDRLLQVMLEMPPAAFERLCQRILRESGFVKVEVTGKTGDGGIDGVGVLRVNLVSFHVLFQAKRWKSSVGAEVVRNFRGAMQGRADKGLIITTGSFTAEARKEATRDGAPAIDLIDGDALCLLLKDLKLGVRVKMVEEVEIDPDFYKSI